MKQVQIKPRMINSRTFSKYLGMEETSILVELVKSVNPRVMIEFGCNLGVTSKRVLDNVPTLQRYIGIDVPEDFEPTLRCQSSEVPERAGAYASEDDRFFLLTCPSLNLKPEKLEPCDAVFIDGDHSEEAVAYESTLARELIRKDGIIVWHDFNNPAVEVTQALTKLYNAGWPIRSVEGSWLAFMRT